MARKKAKAKKQGEEHGVDGTVEGILDEIGETFDETEPTSSVVADGKYQIKIVDALLNRSGSGRPQAVFEMQIANGEFVNRKLWKRDGLDNEESIGWFKAGLKRLGVEVKTNDQLPAVLEELKGTFAEVTVRAKGDFTNVYFNKAIDDDAVDVDGLEDAGDASDEEEGEYWAKGNRCGVDYDGEVYPGTITDIDESSATVKFDDGTEEEIDIDDLQELEEEEGEEGDDESPAPDEAVCEIEFDDDGLTEGQVEEIEALATKYEFDPDDYEDWSSLLADIAEYCEVSGKYAKPTKLIKEVQAVG